MTFREKLKEICGYTDLDNYYGAYTELINYIGYEKLRACIPMSDTDLQEAYKKDQHFNSIPITIWDGWTGNYAYTTRDGAQDFVRKDSAVKRLMSEAGITVFSVSECVSLLKNTARLCVTAP